MEVPKKISNLVGEITDLLHHDFNSLQGWVAILQWPVGETRVINGTYNTKIYQDQKTARFVTQMPPNAKFSQHWHDCTEMCRVLAGVLQDEITGTKWRKDALAIFPKGSNHIPINPSATNTLWLEVTFTR